MKSKLILPGAILHEVIVGAFRSSGSSMGEWCKQQGINPTQARQAAFGQCRGERGQALLDSMIDAAGREVVEVSYRHRMLAEAERLKAA